MGEEKQRRKMANSVADGRQKVIAPRGFGPKEERGKRWEPFDMGMENKEPKGKGTKLKSNWMWGICGGHQSQFGRMKKDDKIICGICAQTILNGRIMHFDSFPPAQ
jgi:hypothetical protein